MNPFDKVVHDFHHRTISMDTIEYLYDVVRNIPFTERDPVFARVNTSFTRYKSFVEYAFERTEHGLRFREGVPNDLRHAIEIVQTYEPMVKLLRNYAAFIVTRL
jgi:hypothetical protein